MKRGSNEPLWVVIFIPIYISHMMHSENDLKHPVHSETDAACFP